MWLSPEWGRICLCPGFCPLQFPGSCVLGKSGWLCPTRCSVLSSCCSFQGYKMDDLPTPYISQMLTAMSKQWGPRSGEGTVGRWLWPHAYFPGSSWLRTISDLCCRGKTLTTQAGRLGWLATMTVSPWPLTLLPVRWPCQEAELPPFTLKHIVGSTPGLL